MKDTKEQKEVAARLKHASDVLGWLAEGKTIQGKYHEREEWEIISSSTPKYEGMVESIMLGIWEYRVRPEPVECPGRVQELQTGALVVVLPTTFRPGTSVRVTVLES